MKIFKVAIPVLAFVVLGVVGHMDLSDAKDGEKYRCEMINSGSWGASKEDREFCKAKGE